MGFAGAIIGPNLRLVRMLAKGGMGSVWVAEHVRLKTQVAVKLVAELLTDDPTAQQRFSLEAEAAAQIRSPHVVQILDHGMASGGVPFIVMELLDGESLGARLRRVGCLGLDETTAIVNQTCKALARAHSLGFIHRDIKPDNIFLTESNDELFVKVLDFGIAKRRDEAMSMTRSGAALGTPCYASPEQLASAKHVTPSADLWSLAVVAYRSLVGRPPFDGESIAAIGTAVSSGTFAAPSKVRTDLPAALDAWFHRALSSNPLNRFPSAREFAETFSLAAGMPAGVVVPARLPSPSEPPFPVGGDVRPPAPPRHDGTRLLSSPSPAAPPVERQARFAQRQFWYTRGSTFHDAQPRHSESVAPASLPIDIPRAGVSRETWMVGAIAVVVGSVGLALVLWLRASPLGAASSSAPADSSLTHVSAAAPMVVPAPSAPEPATSGSANAADTAAPAPATNDF
jgi:serine/threonine-protein kinase